MTHRLSLALAASPRLARSHARTKRNDFPVGLTPQPPICIFSFIELAERESRRAPWGKHARNRRAEDSWRKGEGAEAEMETKDAHI